MSQQSLDANDLQNLTYQFLGDTNQNNYVANVFVLQYLNAAHLEIATQELGIEDIWNFKSVVGQRTYPLPVGYTKVKLVYYNGTPLRYSRIVDEDFFLSGNSYLDRFSIWNDQLIVGCLPPSAVYPMNVYYWREPRALEELTDVPEIPNRFRFGMACYAAAMMAVGDVDEAQFKMLMGEFQKAKTGYREWEDARSTQTLQVRNADADWCGWIGGH